MLSALRRAGEPFQLTPKQLLQQTLVSSGTMTNRIDRLVERGLVTRQTDPDDGRSILVEMSAAGLIRVDAAITRLVDAEAELLGSLSRPSEAARRAAAQAQPRLRLSGSRAAVTYHCARCFDNGYINDSVRHDNSKTSCLDTRDGDSCWRCASRLRAQAEADTDAAASGATRAAK